jgi:hypothetical protein
MHNNLIVEENPFLDRIDRMARIDKNYVNLVSPVEKLRPQAAKFMYRNFSNLLK